MEFQDPNVAAVFQAYPDSVRDRLLELRQLIFAVAAETEGVGELQETLKWGQPSYLTPQSKSGTTIRIDRLRDDDEQYAIYFHCQTTLVDTFRELYGDLFSYEGNRSLHFHVSNSLPKEPLSHCIALALSYHLNKQRTR